MRRLATAAVGPSGLLGDGTEATRGKIGAQVESRRPTELEGNRARKPTNNFVKSHAAVTHAGVPRHDHAVQGDNAITELNSRGCADRGKETRMDGKQIKAQTVRLLSSFFSSFQSYHGEPGSIRITSSSRPSSSRTARPMGPGPKVHS